MTTTTPPVSQLRGASRLVVEATREVTSIVQAMHVAIGGGPWILGRPLEAPLRLVTAPVYGTIRAVAALVGAGIERVLDAVEPDLPPGAAGSPPGAAREAILAVANGVLGDYLLEQGNPLAIPMTLHPRGDVTTGKLAVLVHGSCMTEHQWLRDGHDHGAALARDLGYTPVYARYNSGLHISTNGRELAQQLDALVAGWPVPVEEIVIIGHSMGGLVARAALHEPHACRAQVRALVTLGTPHRGAPLERGGSWLHFLLGVHRYSAPLARLARLRSAGITDLRHGYIRDEHWQGRDRFAISSAPEHLPATVPTYLVAGAIGARGDGMVPVDSALGIDVPEAQRLRVDGVGHIDLLGAPAVYAALRAWLA